MSLISKYARAIRDGIGKFAHAVRERWPVLTVTILGICVPFYAMAWWLNIHDNPAANIAITVLVSTMPVIRFFSQPEPLTFRSFEVWLAVLGLTTVTFYIAEKYDIRILSFSFILVILALPYGLVIWQILRREWLLYVGLTLALAATMIYWIAALVINEESFELLLFPLPIILAGGVLWAPLAWWTLKSARSHKNRRISGPGTQVLAMTMLFFPVTLVAVALPTDLGLSAMWSNVSLALIGILLSAVISEPLRRFFIEWGRLAPSKR